VSNELSNYRGADQQPHPDNFGSFVAPAMEIDDHLACFTPKQSDAHDWVLRIPCRSFEVRCCSATTVTA
jgi:hypothetical protein